MAGEDIGRSIIIADGEGWVRRCKVGVPPPLEPLLRRDPPDVRSIECRLLSAVVQTERRLEEEPVDLHVDLVVAPDADDAADLLCHGK